MKITFKADVKPRSSADQDRLDAAGAALDLLLAQVHEVRKRLIDAGELVSSGETTWEGAEPGSKQAPLLIVVAWESEDVRPPN